MKRSNFFLPEQIIEELRTLSDKTGLPMSELIRRAISDFLDKQKQHAVTDDQR